MHPLNRTQNTRRNIVWGLIARALTVLGPFVVRAVLIRRLGAEYLGVSSLYTSILQVLSLAELGFSSAVVFGMYGPIADGDVRQVAAYLNYFKGVYRRVGLAILGMGIGVLPFLDLLVKGSAPPDVDLRLAFIIYLANTALSYFMFAYKQALLTAYQRSDLISKATMVASVLQYGLQVAVLIAWPNYYAYALVLPLCTVASNLAVSHVVDRELPEFGDESLRSEALSPDLRRDVRKRIAGIMVGKVCGVTRDSLDSLIISAYVGLVAVAAYGNYLTVAVGLHSVLGIACTSMTAAVGNSVATESKERNFSQLRLFCLLYAMPSIVCASCMMACYQPFIGLWVGEGLVLPIEIPVLMTAYFYVLTMGDIRSVYVEATGIWWELRRRSVTEAVVNVVLNVVLVQLMGLPGVVLATLVSLFAINFVYGSHLIFKHYFGLHRAWEFYFDQLLYLAVAAFSCALSYNVASFAPGNGAFALVLRAIVAAGVSACVQLLAFHRMSRFGEAVAFVRGLFSS